METRYCSKCGQPIKKGYVCDKCKNKRKSEYLKEYFPKYYQRRKAEIKNLREELARYKKQVENTKNAD